MMGRSSQDQGQLFYSFNLAAVVPDDHLVRAIAGVLDLSWVRAELAPHYSHIGRPSIDPVLMIRMLIVGYVFAIRSECALCREVQLNLAYRWFCGLGIEDTIPYYSIRQYNHRRFRVSNFAQTPPSDAPMLTQAGSGLSEELPSKKNKEEIMLRPRISTAIALTFVFGLSPSSSVAQGPADQQLGNVNFETSCNEVAPTPLRPRYALPAFVLVPRVHRDLRGNPQGRPDLRHRLLGHCAEPVEQPTQSAAGAQPGARARSAPKGEGDWRQDAARARLH